jgi:hypothetical protein
MFCSRRKTKGQKFFIKGTLSRIAICGIAFSVVASQSLSLACAAERSKQAPTDGTSAGDKTAGYKDSGLKIQTEDSLQDGDVVLTLGYIRDCSLAVHDLRELSLNIFDECTRKHLDAKDPISTVSKQISEAYIDLNAKYHAPRPAWIFFYIATFEPILQLFRNATTTEPASKAKLIVPKSMEAGTKEGLVKIDNVIDSIDTQVERLNILLDEDPNNSVEMAKAAVSIYNSTNELDSLIAKTYKDLQESLNKGEKETVGVE